MMIQTKLRRSRGQMFEERPSRARSLSGLEGNETPTLRPLSGR